MSVASWLCAFDRMPPLHTETPHAPYNQGIIWVLYQSKQHRDFVGMRVWIKSHKWSAAVRARRNETATEQQLQLLADGHWEDKARC